MGGASREQEYAAKTLEIIVLTLTMPTERPYGLGYPSRSIINRKMTILRVYNKKVIDWIS